MCNCVCGWHCNENPIQMCGVLLFSKRMSSEPVVLSIDLGTSSVRASAWTKAGKVIASAQSTYPLEYPKDGHCEQDAALLLSETIKVQFRHKFGLYSSR